MISKIRNINGKDFTIFGDEEDKSVYNNIIHGSDYENHMIDFYRELLKEDSVCIDAGANIGILSMYMSCFTKAKIYAFEPAIENFEMLLKNIEANQLNVEPIFMGLGNKTGKMRFVFNREHSGDASLLYENQEKFYDSPIDDKREIALITLDDFVASRNITKLDVLKMDVEGFESLVIEGGKKTIETLRPDIVTEFCPPMIRTRELSSEGYYDMLKKYYEHIYFIDRPNMQLIKTSSHENLERIMSSGYNNIGDVFATNKTL